MGRPLVDISWRQEPGTLHGTTEIHEVAIFVSGLEAYRARTLSLSLAQGVELKLHDGRTLGLSLLESGHLAVKLDATPLFELP